MNIHRIPDTTIATLNESVETADRLSNYSLQDALADRQAAREPNLADGYGDREIQRVIARDAAIARYLRKRNLKHQTILSSPGTWQDVVIVGRDEHGDTTYRRASDVGDVISTLKREDIHRLVDLAMHHELPVPGDDTGATDMYLLHEYGDHGGSLEAVRDAAGSAGDEEQVEIIDAYLQVQ